MKTNLREQAAAYRHPNNKREILPIGAKFGLWEVIENNLYQQFKTQKHTASLVRCECGTERLITNAGLQSGKTLSCGCRKGDWTKTRYALIPVGTLFGALTVIENGLYVHKKCGRTDRACRLRCECGTEIVRSYPSLRRKIKLQSCGCRGHETKKAQHALVGVGTQFGDWIVLENGLYKTQGETTSRACRVRCICGTEAIVTTSYLTRCASRACGHRRRVVGIEEAWRQLHISLSGRGREFTLTIPELKFITQLPCLYCEREPSNKFHAKYTVDGKSRRDFDPSRAIRWSGIDRVDSSKDYVHGNVVPCCADCNRMKNALSLDVFLDLVARIQKTNPSTDGLLHRATRLF